MTLPDFSPKARFGNDASNGGFIVNPIRQGDNYANSGFRRRGK